ncbi:hypothetical protein PHYBLDRAFT_165656 [Phycomyces blakesleeanus NRRL 1555(-)]|uniref:Uncharacterized protein n=1 Tax=Phycomyces blakesleeanus (strain ATCC 8743b / DSM 1359 / FGSC 10004 / NBRC 33097 / NRRL 1555) TaxID=763407 RepID=A0A162PYI5_PHYB8|nr:hypothetical protein PHYBLDRAFT_165656 [Phycomyces blakesleeanus NRRL 1555(-)]OAD77167.1 hypothetical protein PHYBLDRAFT_165656 [Phycomyces blakesleeanus NRRL 1555(-)]|eukprot:XP_018295207.1 hypothetical protein PHYBLDRAFT_165656 [Phycomyces blakesleeanus NRRL 1555(-)]
MYARVSKNAPAFLLIKCNLSGYIQRDNRFKQIFKESVLSIRTLKNLGNIRQYNVDRLETWGLSTLCLFGTKKTSFGKSSKHSVSCFEYKILESVIRCLFLVYSKGMGNVDIVSLSWRYRLIR